MSNVMNDKYLEAAAVKFANELNKYPTEIAVGVGVILPNLINGCSWGFVNDSNVEFKKCLSAIQSNENISALKITGGYLVNINMDYLLQLLEKIAKGCVTTRDLQIASNHRRKALLDLEKFMKKGGSGKIGIYNLNDSPRITVNGISYPAFCVTMPDLLTMCVRNGYGLKLGGVVRTANQVASHIEKVVNRLEIAPSGNALFVEITKLH